MALALDKANDKILLLDVLPELAAAKYLSPLLSEVWNTPLLIGLYVSKNLKPPVVPVAFGRPAASTAVESPPLSGLEFNLRYQGQSRWLYGGGIAINATGI